MIISSWQGRVIGAWPMKASYKYREGSRVQVVKGSSENSRDKHWYPGILEP
jgi:hypothetical protein